MTRAARSGTAAGEKEAREVWRPITIFGLWVVVIGAGGAGLTGHFQGQEMVELQPMKMAAAEAICVDTEGAAFTVAAFGDCPLEGDGGPTRIITIPGMASFLASNSFTSPETGVQGAQEQLVELLNANSDFVDRYGDAAQYDFRPPQMPVFWTFRLMIGVIVFPLLLVAWGLLALRGGRIPTDPWLGRYAIFSIITPFLGVAFGWIFTEMGRQPFVVYPNLDALNSGAPLGSVVQMTEVGISTAVSPIYMLLSMILFTVLYGVLGVIWVWLMRRYTIEGIHDPVDEELDSSDPKVRDEAEAQALNFGY